MIEPLIAALRRAGLEPTADELAEALWLAVQIGAREAAASAPVGEADPRRASAAPPAPPGDDLSPPTAGAESDAPPPIAAQAEDPPPETGPEGGADAYLPAGAGAEAVLGGALEYRWAAPEALPGAAALARALRPLKRRRPARTRAVLDEEATVNRVAETGARYWLPVLRPAPARWFDVALVFDEGASTVIWRRAADALGRLMATHGAFGDVRPWTLRADGPGGRPRLYGGLGPAALAGTPHPPRELIDPAGRRLVLVVSDCVGEHWYDGALAEALALWGRAGPLALAHVLPRTFWHRTALGAMRPARLSAPAPGVANRRLVASEPRRGRGEAPPAAGLPLPILSLEPAAFLAWGRMVAGAGGAWTQGVLLPEGPLPRPAPLAAPDADEPGAEERLRAFRAMASPTARQLAGYLAASPLNLGLIRAVQRAMLPRSEQHHLAEVLLGGLLRQVTPEGAPVEPDEIAYEFYPGVAELLLNTVRHDELAAVLARVTDYLQRESASPVSFRALLADPAAAEALAVAAGGRAFSLPLRALERMGGDYRRLAERLSEQAARAAAARPEPPPAIPLEAEELTAGEPTVGAPALEQAPPVCPVCASPVRPGDQYCYTCGAVLAADLLLEDMPRPTRSICPQCGNSVLPGEEFCANCGTFLGHFTLRLSPEEAAIALDPTGHLRPRARIGPYRIVRRLPNEPEPAYEAVMSGGKKAFVQELFAIGGEDTAVTAQCEARMRFTSLLVVGGLYCYGTDTPAIGVSLYAHLAAHGPFGWDDTLTLLKGRYSWDSYAGKINALDLRVIEGFIALIWGGDLIDELHPDEITYEPRLRADLRARYRPPERRRDGPLGPEAAVFSMACVIHACLTGQPPSLAPTGGARLVALPESAPAGAAAVLRRALDRDPTRRYASVSELFEALEGAPDAQAGAQSPVARSGALLVGRYELGQQISSGTLSTTFRARDLVTAREVAIRMLNQHLLGGRGVLEAFAHQALALTTLRHQGIAALYDVFRDGELLFIVTEPVASDLNKLIERRGRLPWLEALELLRPLCEAVDYAHRVGVVYGNLSPFSILLTDDGRPLLGDLWIAPASVIDIPGANVRRHSYVAPEMREGDAPRAPSDIYALACVTCELLTGEVLFQGSTPQSITVAHLRGPMLPQKWPDSVPAGVGFVLSKAMSRDPARRYPSAMAYYEALVRLSFAPAQSAEVARYWGTEPIGSLDDIIGPYQVIRRVAVTGFGEIFEAVNSMAQRVRLYLANKPGDVVGEMFRNAAHVLAIVSHPGIPHIYDAGSLNGRPFLATKFVDGQSLQQRLATGGVLLVDQALNWIDQLAEILDVLHNQGYIHRDVKPFNIVLDADRLYLMGFELVGRIVRGDGVDTLTGAYTPAYAPPEQIAGNPDQGVAVDIFAMGATVYELLTRTRPPDVRQRLNGAALPLPGSLQPDLPLAVDEILAKALDLDPAQRYQRASELAAALRKVFEEGGPASLPPPHPEPPITLDFAPPAPSGAAPREVTPQVAPAAPAQNEGLLGRLGRFARRLFGGGGQPIPQPAPLDRTEAYPLPPQGARDAADPERASAPPLTEPQPGVLQAVGALQPTTLPGYPDDTGPPPERIGRYRIVGPLGRGGYATVYAATDERDGRPVALKVLFSSLAADPRVASRFRREAQTMAGLRHPGIVEVYAVDQADGWLYIALERAQGDLYALLAEGGPLPWAEALTLIAPIADALDFAHERGLVHRDVKPGNILSVGGRLKLGDFGLAEASAPGTVIGTPAYMAPEVWSGQGGPATDRYALACVIFEMVTGRRPFAAEGAAQLLRAHASGPALPEEWPAGAPPAVAAVFRRALAPDPAARYASCAELVAALEGGPA